MLRIRFFRTSKKNQPFFKIVVTEKSRPPRGGRFVEEVGFYNPLTKEKSLKAERIKYWLSKGAKPSDRVFNLLIKEGILKGKKIPVHKKKKIKKGTEEKPSEAPKESPAAAAAVAGKEKPAETPKTEEKPAEAEKSAEKPKEEPREPEKKLSPALSSEIMENKEESKKE